MIATQRVGYCNALVLSQIYFRCGRTGKLIRCTSC